MKNRHIEVMILGLVVDRLTDGSLVLNGRSVAWME